MNQESFNRGFCNTCEYDSCSSMGYHADKYKSRGIKFLNTNEQEPFTRYDCMFEASISRHSPPFIGTIYLVLGYKTSNNRTVQVPLFV